MIRITKGRAVALAAPLLALSATLASATPDRPECIAPAQPGGGFDITCKLAQTALTDAGVLEAPLRVSYMPGGIGAVAYSTIVGQRTDEPGTIVAFSAGSLLNLAQGKFGAHDEGDVRWVASIGTDYGAVVVPADSEWESLAAMMEGIKADAGSVILGAGGTIGSQDWMKAALTARAAGIDHKSMRFVAFEGGGDCATALQGGHVDACMNDVGDSQAAIDGGAPLKLLAVFAPDRLPGKLAEVPTAAEQGFDIEWPIVRGFYVGPEVSDADYQWWVDAFETAMAAPGYAALLESRSLLPLPMTGDELDAFVTEAVATYRTLAGEFELVQQ
ncbi:tripartite tricarboxylate transporter substrate binding protein [Frigidibacter albus]|uniref:Tripartite tricarboxylate transporter substrate binding protein n=1 Tax=Frigidibacter albus TaxID=1465486 RepID=A0A6L8VMD6_9RHOB|nr:tripartite tricarboxylate transporter substrate-binding protein [Frigidibacter albus]MZQ90936.1 tripartite tricarboxylate transporter substrate binding protein [Frigidibacter albus]NBE32821.1 tripartite tricarboxylate transporter substrate binding protein [Frigidibacter albus]GGH61877.1 C4-dicarboxylate ABC transporter substrate-binding protein [Frigidibacter albus]